MHTITVVLYTHLNDVEVGDIAELVPIIPELPKMPKGFSIAVSGGERKFIILAKGNELVLAIGPLLTHFYYHKELLAGSRRMFMGYEISGGGSVSFELRGGEWRAKFGGSSGDFGVFDPRILFAATRKEIEKATGCSASFEWND